MSMIPNDPDCYVAVFQGHPGDEGPKGIQGIQVSSTEIKRNILL